MAGLVIYVKLVYLSPLVGKLLVGLKVQLSGVTPVPGTSTPAADLVEVEKSAVKVYKGDFLITVISSSEKTTLDVVLEYLTVDLL